MSVNGKERIIQKKQSTNTISAARKPKQRVEKNYSPKHQRGVKSTRQFGKGGVSPSLNNKSIGKEKPTFDKWPATKRLSERVQEVMPLKQEFMPKKLAELVFPVAKTVSTHPDFVFVLMLTTLAATIGHKIHIQVENDENYVVAVNTYGILVAPSGSGKTPPYEFVKINFVSCVAQFIERENIENRAQYDVDSFVNNHEVKRLEKEASRLLTEANEASIQSEKRKKTREAKHLIKKAKALNTSFTEKVFSIDNFTFLTMAKLLAENNNGFLIYSDEISGLLSQLKGRQAQQVKSLLLEAWNGFGSYRTGRIKGNSIHAENMLLSIVGTIQPTKLKEYVKGAIQGSSEDDGFFNRFQLVTYPSKKMDCEIQPPALPKHLIPEWQVLLKNLYHEDFGFDGECTCKQRKVKFSPKAQESYQAWLKSLRVKVADTNLSTFLSQHLRKFEVLVPKIALIYQVIISYDVSEQFPFDVQEVDYEATTFAISPLCQDSCRLKLS